MKTIRTANERGHVNFGWLDSWHSFSFGSYFDPRYMGSSALRVINDDIVAPHTGFGMHSHSNMEILTVMLAGRITHKDSMQNEAHLDAGEYQLMSAGSGLKHSEMNQGDSPVHLLQIWLEPNESDTEPGYRQQRLPEAMGLTLIASAEGENGSFKIRQDAAIWRGKFKQDQIETINIEINRTGWLQLISGSLLLDDEQINAADGVEIKQQTAFKITALEDIDFLYFDLP